MNRRSLLAIPAAGLAIIFGSHYLFDNEPPQKPKPPKPKPRRIPVKEWIRSAACKGRKQCYACRTDVKFQAQLAKYFVVPEGWPKCPHGFTDEDHPEVSLVGLPKWIQDRLTVCPCKKAHECSIGFATRCYRLSVLKRPRFSCTLIKPVA